MSERSSLTQGVQIGVEATPGTDVRAPLKLQSIGIEPAVKVDMQRFRPMGQKFASVVTPGKEWCESKISGKGSYTELLYLLASVLENPVSPTTSDTTARTWLFEPAISSEDDVVTYTVEQGGAVRAHKFNYGVVNSLELAFSRDGIDVSGTMLGQKLQDEIDLTPTPTAVAEQEILPTDIDVFLDPTYGALGGTKLTRVLKATAGISDRFGTVWPLNSALESFGAIVETEPKAIIKLLVEADSAGMALLDTMRAGDSKFIRISATSDVLAGSATVPFSLIWDSAVKVSDVSEFSDEDGIYAIEWTFEIVADGAWGKALSVSLCNKITHIHTGGGS